MSGIPDLLLCDVCRISLILAPAHLLHGCHHRLKTDISSVYLINYVKLGLIYSSHKK
jgi:hypothetical protein